VCCHPTGTGRDCKGRGADDEEHVRIAGGMLVLHVRDRELDIGKQTSDEVTKGRTEAGQYCGKALPLFVTERVRCVRAGSGAREEGKVTVETFVQ